MSRKGRNVTGSSTVLAFPRFPDLPAELQTFIWELAMLESSFLWAGWPSHEMGLLAPICPIPNLGPNDPIGLIPYGLPAEMPRTLSSHPLPSGLPAGTVDAGYDTSLRIMSMTNRSTFARIDDSWTKSLRKMIINANEVPPNSIKYHPALTFLSVCRLSRQVVLTRRAIVKTRQKISPDLPAGVGGNPTFHPSFKGGALSGNIFKDQNSGRSCVVFALGSDPSNPPTNMSAPGKAKSAYRYTHVAARLGDIEKCIFGSRLSLTKIQDGLDQDRFKDIEAAMWWRPDLGSRVRRPEAGHPFYITPETILSVYSAVLHQFADPQAAPCMGGRARNALSLHPHGQWYFSLLEEGRCSHCFKKLLLPLRQLYPQLIDDDGYIDVILLLDRGRFEQPEPTQSVRSHEIGE